MDEPDERSSRHVSINRLMIKKPGRQSYLTLPPGSKKEEEDLFASDLLPVIAMQNQFTSIVASYIALL